MAETTSMTKSTAVKYGFGATLVTKENLNILDNVDKILSREKAFQQAEEAALKNETQRITEYATTICNKIKSAVGKGDTVAYYELTETDKNNADRRVSLRDVMRILNNEDDSIDAKQTLIKNPQYTQDPNNQSLGIPYTVDGKIQKDTDLFGYSIKAQKKINGKFTSTTVVESIIEKDKWHTKDVDRFVISWESNT